MTENNSKTFPKATLQCVCGRTLLIYQRGMVNNSHCECGRSFQMLSASPEERPSEAIEGK